jgi:hypothetical protein
MEFGCSICEYTSSKKENVIRHINKKKSCGSDIRELIEIPVDINCEFCNKNFSTATSLFKHQKNNCKYKEDALKQKIKKLEKELEEQKIMKINKNMIRTEARKIYKQNYKKLICVHCKNKNEHNIQICHIKAVKDFNNNSNLNEINDLSNLISLCANCHLDLDKAEKSEVIRTSLLHKFIVKHLQFLVIEN